MEVKTNKKNLQKPTNRLIESVKNSIEDVSDIDLNDLAELISEPSPVTKSIKSQTQNKPVVNKLFVSAMQ